MQQNSIPTPFYIYDFDLITQRYEALRSAFCGAAFNVFYAIKANSNLSLLRHLAQLDSGFDCVSAGEIRRALLAGAKPYKIIFSGVGKTADEINFALEQKILYINAESAAELGLIEQIARSRGQRAHISLRINPDVDARTHPYISTGLRENKFGVALEAARGLYLRAHRSEWLEPVAVHFHIGSQLLDLQPVVKAAQMVRDFVGELLAAGLKIRFFDVGGGVGIAYENGEKEPNLREFGEQIKRIAGDLSICCEPGRYLVGPAGRLVTSVVREKVNEGKRFVIVDASMAELLRPSLYGARHRVEFALAQPRAMGEITPADVVGGVCESGDFLAKDALLPALLPGDRLEILDTGAYGQSMASNYNSRCKIAEFALEGGHLRQIARAQSFEELIAAEAEFLEK